MEEKILIKSEKRSNVLRIIIVIVCIVIPIVSIVSSVLMEKKYLELEKEAFDSMYDYFHNNVNGKVQKEYNEALETNKLLQNATLIIVPLCLAALIIIYIRYCSTKDMKLVVSDKRVYGKSSFGKSIDLSLDSVSAVGIKGKDCITISTASGRIPFKGFANRDELYQVLRYLIITRMNSSVVTEENANVAYCINPCKYCTKCGMRLAATDTFCSKCGSQIHPDA